MTDIFLFACSRLLSPSSPVLFLAGHFLHISWQWVGERCRWRPVDGRGRESRTVRLRDYELEWVYLGEGLLLLNAPLRLHLSHSSSSPFLPLPPPLCCRKRYEKVIMFPLEIACSPSAPFISKWNNLSFFSPSLHLHLSFCYTTPAPFLLFFISLLLSFSSLQPSSI